MAKLSVTYRLNTGETRKYLKQAIKKAESVTKGLKDIYKLFEKISEEDIALYPIKDEGFETLQDEHNI